MYKLHTSTLNLATGKADLSHGGGCVIAMRMTIGSHRIVDWPVGEQLPRIC
ncbi:MAG: hypothetical protein PHH26_03760 [Candidatus Thermoplasmatota archaeon]|nr:hypothetical protein [Candidatus Thermoplasmatota archaeon]